jgi:predicted RNA-binding Zn-ribbon protein involved in translation (DUF1610 family)
VPGEESLYHIVVQGSPKYWLHVAAGSKARLSDLDRFLRDIWLECCGHLSCFEIGEQTYLSRKMQYEEGESMNALIRKVLIPGMEFSHEYDFGTTTRLSLRVAGELHGAARKAKIVLLARNLPVLYECVECGKPAIHVCSQCSWGSDAWFCDPCASEHECGEEMLLPVVNSPRVGLCGYTG